MDTYKYAQILRCDAGMFDNLTRVITDFLKSAIF